MQIWHTDPTMITLVATYIHRTLRVRGVPYQRRGLFAQNDVRSAGESGTHSSLQYTHPTAPSYKKGRADNRPLSTPKLVSPHLRDVLSSHPRLRGWRMVEAGPPIASGCDEVGHIRLQSGVELRSCQPVTAGAKGTLIGHRTLTFRYPRIIEFNSPNCAIIPPPGG